MLDATDSVGDPHHVALIVPRSEAIGAVRVSHTAGGAVHGIHGGRWRGPRQRAVCVYGGCRVAAANSRCSCGIGVAETADDLGAMEYLYDCDAPLLATVRVWGHLIGDVTDEGEVGCLRAQFVEVVAIADVAPVDGHADLPEACLTAAQVAAMWGGRVRVVDEGEITRLARVVGAAWPVAGIPASIPDRYRRGRHL